jgi:hypothetical protein
MHVPVFFSFLTYTAATFPAHQMSYRYSDTFTLTPAVQVNPNHIFIYIISSSARTKINERQELFLNSSTATNSEHMLKADKYLLRLMFRLAVAEQI